MFGGMPEQPRRVTAADVASRAGCSTAAVSLYLNGKAEGRLTEAWRQRIAAAIDELGYVPNRAARHLSTGSSRTVVLFFPGARFSFFGDVVDEVTAALGDDWEVQLVDNRPAEGAAPRAPLDRALALAPAAFIVVGASRGVLAELERTGVPTVVLDVDDLPGTFSIVPIDYVQALRGLAERMRDAGMLTVGYLAFEHGTASLVQRRPRVAAALAEQGVRMLDDADDLGVPGPDRDAVAEAFVAQWPRWSELGVQAVVCGDERLAYGVLKGARELGLRIPEDLGLAAFDDLPPASLLQPSLSSIRLDGHELGAAAGRAVVEHLRTRRPSVQGMATTWVPRESTAR